MPVGAAGSIAASSVINQVQHAQQMSLEVNHRNIDAQASRENQQKQTSVTTAPDSQKLQLQQKQEEERRKKREQAENEEEENQEELDENGVPKNYKRINVKV